MLVSGILTLIGVIVWLYLLSVCERGELTFYHFMVGSIGMFILCMFQSVHYQDHVIAAFVRLLSPIGINTGMFAGFPEAGAFLIANAQTSMSFYIDLECSGIIEMLVFICLIAFFNVYSVREKFLKGIMGVLMIILFNSIRMLLILTIIYHGGEKYYLISHSIVGRIVFYVLTIILYYRVFTKQQIDRQKVGEFSYESSVLD